MDGLVQDCNNSIANAMELPQSCTTPSNYVPFPKYSRLHKSTLSATHSSTWVFWIMWDLCIRRHPLVHTELHMAHQIYSDGKSLPASHANIGSILAMFPQLMPIPWDSLWEKIPANVTAEFFLLQVDFTKVPLDVSAAFMTLRALVIPDLQQDPGRRLLRIKAGCACLLKLWQNIGH